MAMKKYLSLDGLAEYDALVKEEIANAVSTKANSSHTHTVANVTNLQTTLDNINEEIDGSIKNLSVSGKTITYTKNDGSTGTITTQDTDTKVTNTLATTTKAYVTGTTSATTNTSTQVFDTGVYLDTTAGQLTATTFKGALDGNAKTATTATSATSATKATQDGSGNTITSTYETKSAASAKLTEAKTYADNAAAQVKNDLLNGAGGAYDTLKELGDLIDVNVNAIDALETVAAGKADKNHTHNYAGSSSAGGAATSANKLNTNAGSATQPVYFTNGIPVATTYTLGKSVPSDAKFTDTTYSKATTTSNGLMSLEDKTKLNYTNVAYGTCSTEAATAAKVITVSGNTQWALTAGSTIVVKFSYTNSAQNPTFNINGTGAKSVWYNTALITTSNLGYAGTANRPMEFIYDGTQYVFMGWSVDTNTTYSNAALGQGYATCTTAESTTAKVGTLSSYSLQTGGVVSVKFTYAVPASATLNINSKGAKAIYYKGAAITGSVIKAGDIATFIYNGSQYHLISIDRWQSDIVNLQTQIDGKANNSHGNHVPATQTASNKVFLRNDNTWQTITPANIGAATSSHTHTIDTALSSTSTNPVQNKVVNSAISTLTSTVSTNTSSINSHTSAISALQTAVAEIQEITSEEITSLFNN